MKGLLIALMAIMLVSAAAVAAPTGDLLAGVEPGPDGVIDVLTVFAHADDENYAGGTLLKLKQSDSPPVRLHLACLTKGDLSGAKDVLRISGDYLAEIRAAELISAAAVYRADEVIQLDYPDQGLKPADRAELVAKLRALMDRTGAELVITHDPSGLSRHPDHVTCSAATLEAFTTAKAQRLYYSTYPAAVFYSVAAFTPFHEIAPRAKPTIKVDVRRQLKLKRLALDEHASQMRYSTTSIGVIQDVLLTYEWFALAAEK